MEEIGTTFFPLWNSLQRDCRPQSNAGTCAFRESKQSWAIVSSGSVTMLYPACMRGRQMEHVRVLEAFRKSQFLCYVIIYWAIIELDNIANRRFLLKESNTKMHQSWQLIPSSHLPLYTIRAYIPPSQFLLEVIFISKQEYIRTEKLSYWSSLTTQGSIWK